MSEPPSDAAVPGLIEERRGAVRVLSLDRPQVRNALSTELLDQVGSALARAQHDREVRAVVIAGRGGTFASGADIGELRDTDPATYLTWSRQEAWDAIYAFSKPLVAAVAGYALGGGCELALRADSIVAGDDAVFGQPEVLLGIVAGAGGVQFWTRALGHYRAGEILLSGRHVDAYEAHRLGLVSRIVPSEAVIDAGVALADEFARGAPLASRFGKAMARQAYESPMSSALRHDRALLATLLSTNDHVEGMNAVLERRSPHFEGT